MKKIGIIGGGFCGTMFCVHLIRNAENAIDITLIEQGNAINKGIAFYPPSESYLLNVAASGMSAFGSDKDHFVQWLMLQNEYQGIDHDLIALSFVSRHSYGLYLTSIWREAVDLAQSKNIKIEVIQDKIYNLEKKENFFNLKLSQGSSLLVSHCIIATGYHPPSNLKLSNNTYINCKTYFQNPWNPSAITGVNPHKAILIIGNGLTMVDVIIGLREKGHRGEIVSISSHGLDILPHRNYQLNYRKFITELNHCTTLLDHLKLFNRHYKKLKKFGLTAEPIIDALRPYTHEIWKKFTTEEKIKFLSTLRHFWGVARHRIPVHIFDQLQTLKINGVLKIYAGTIEEIKPITDESFYIKYFDKKCREAREIIVSRVINCTGPETDLTKIEDHFLKNCLSNGLVSQDDLKLGIRVDETNFEIINSKGEKVTNLYTLGPNLKGLLWESTAVSELRLQAEKLANIILNQ